MRLKTRRYVMVQEDGDEFPLHRLIAVAEYGFQAVKDNDIHHESEVAWDNRPSNLRPVDPGEHVRIHSKGRDNYAQKDTPYRDESVMRELYIDRGLSTYEVADKLETSRTTVIRWLKKHGIDRRPPGRPS